MKHFITFAILLFTINGYSQDTISKKKNPIKSFKVWYNGVQYDADDLNVICVEDDFQTFANFKWQLFDSTTRVIAQGYLIMKGNDYINYITQENHGKKAINWVMNQLNLQPIVNKRQ